MNYIYLIIEWYDHCGITVHEAYRNKEDAENAAYKYDGIYETEIEDGELEDEKPVTIYTIVEWYDHCGIDVHGAFLNRENAEEKLKKYGDDIHEVELI